MDAELKFCSFDWDSCSEWHEHLGRIDFSAAVDAAKARAKVQRKWFRSNVNGNLADQPMGDVSPPASTPPRRPGAEGLRRASITGSGELPEWSPTSPEQNEMLRAARAYATMVCDSESEALHEHAQKLLADAMHCEISRRLAAQSKGQGESEMDRLIAQTTDDCAEEVRDEVVRVKVVNEKKVLDPMQRTFSTENLTSPGSDCTTSPTSPTSRAWEQYQQKADQWARDDERCAREAEAKASEGERRRSEQIRKAAEELERRNQAARAAEQAEHRRQQQEQLNREHTQSQTNSSMPQQNTPPMFQRSHSFTDGSANKEGVGSTRSPRRRFVRRKSSSEFNSANETKRWEEFEQAVASSGDVTIAMLPVPAMGMLRKLTTTHFKEMARRWHPDKFMQQYGEKLKREEAKDILEAVVQVFQDINNGRV